MSGLLSVHTVPVGSLVLGGGNDPINQVRGDLIVFCQVARRRQWPAVEGLAVTLDGDLLRNRYVERCVV